MALPFIWGNTVYWFFTGFLGSCNCSSSLSVLVVLILIEYVSNIYSYSFQAGSLKEHSFSTCSWVANSGIPIWNYCRYCIVLYGWMPWPCQKEATIYCKCIVQVQSDDHHMGYNYFFLKIVQKGKKEVSFPFPFLCSDDKNGKYMSILCSIHQMWNWNFRIACHH